MTIPREKKFTYNEIIQLFNQYNVPLSNEQRKLMSTLNREDRDRIAREHELHKIKMKEKGMLKKQKRIARELLIKAKKNEAAAKKSKNDSEAAEKKFETA